MGVDCLESLVGFVGCDESLTYPFRLENIGYSERVLRELMDGSFSTVADFVAACREHAARELMNDVLTKTVQGVQIGTVRESRTIGMVDGKPQYTGTGLSGILIELDGTGDYMKFVLSKVKIFSGVKTTATVKVVNVDSGEVVETFTVDTEADRVMAATPHVEVEIPREGIRLFVGVDVTGLNAYAMKLADRAGCCGKKPTYTSSFGRFKGAGLGAGHLYGDIEWRKETPLSVDYSIVCDHEAWVCSARGVLGVAMLHKTAMAVLAYGMDSGGQFSEQKTTNADNNVERYARSLEAYNSAMRGVMESRVFPRTKCFTCDSVTRVTNRLPG